MVGLEPPKSTLPNWKNDNVKYLLKDQTDLFFNLIKNKPVRTQTSSIFL